MLGLENKMKIGLIKIFTAEGKVFCLRPGVSELFSTRTTLYILQMYSWAKRKIFFYKEMNKIISEAPLHIQILPITLECPFPIRSPPITLEPPFTKRSLS